MIPAARCHAVRTTCFLSSLCLFLRSASSDSTIRQIVYNFINEQYLTRQTCHACTLQLRTRGNHATAKVASLLRHDATALNDQALALQYAKNRGTCLRLRVDGYVARKCG
ncbi:hypothetical protein GGR56DRAFT_46326 [Xylariaceae sp. FL0804]|nr:hypothetical protein GGR56DRAFT_46326 [Xylariaceae sp. FL0804]